MSSDGKFVSPVPAATFFPKIDRGCGGLERVVVRRRRGNSLDERGGQQGIGGRVLLDRVKTELDVLGGGGDGLGLSDDALYSCHSGNRSAKTTLLVWARASLDSMVTILLWFWSIPMTWQPKTQPTSPPEPETVGDD